MPDSILDALFKHDVASRTAAIVHYAPHWDPPSCSIVGTSRKDAVQVAHATEREVVA